VGAIRLLLVGAIVLTQVGASPLTFVGAIRLASVGATGLTPVGASADVGMLGWPRPCEHAVVAKYAPTPCPRRGRDCTSARYGRSANT